MVVVIVFVLGMVQSPESSSELELELMAVTTDPLQNFLRIGHYHSERVHKIRLEFHVPITNHN